MGNSRLPKLVQALPMDDVVRIEQCESIPVFRSTPRVQERIETLLEKQAEASLDVEEERELDKYEELDDFLSLVNRLVRNAMLGDEPDGLARTA